MRKGSHVRGLGNSALVFGLLVGLVSCQGSGERSEEALERASQSLSATATRTYGFESLQDWSPLWSSPQLLLSSLHTEGQSSLALHGGGWMQIQSGALAKEGPAPSVVGYDVRVPNNPSNPWWYGSTELSFDAPSAGIWGQFVGQADLINLPPGQFKRVQFTLPPGLVALLNGNYSDLRLRIVVNVSSGETADYLLDHFTFGPASTTCTPQPDGNPCTDDVCVNGAPAWSPLPIGAACDTNSTVCDGSGTCSAGAVCVLGAPPVVDDGNPCTSDACDPVNGPVHLPVAAGVSCESDGDVCNGIARCDGSGTCTPGAAPVVDDDNPCTVDSCDAQLGVQHQPRPAGASCDLDGDVCNGQATCDTTATCVPGEAPVLDDGNPCTADSCDPISGVLHAAVANGSACDDGSACTLGDSCQAGACAAGSPRLCPALDQCHDVGVCEPASGACSAPLKPDGSVCDDGNACTQVDACANGACQGSATVVCAAQDACHAAGACDAATGTCSNPLQPDGLACDDDSICNGGETCQSGSCVASAPPALDDGNPCTADACDPVAGVTHTAVADGTSCESDGDVCNGISSCASGSCVSSASPSLDDGNACTVDSCDPVGGVLHVAVANGSACDDGNACTSGDVCQAGACAPGSPQVCVALDSCHDAGSCDPTTGACSSPPKLDGASCDDGDACTALDTCNNAACQGGAPVVCAPLDTCHLAGVCDSLAGTCSNPPQPDGLACDDDSVCNGHETCQSGSCVASAPPSLDDGNPCTADACDLVAGVTHTAVADGTNCESDGDLCNGVSTCSAGACTAGSPPSLDDGNPCTVDSCTAQQGPIHSAAAAGTACSDANLCNGFETCDGAGACVAGAPALVDDNNACTADSCDAATGILSHSPLPAGSACGDGQVCDASGFCEEPPPVLVVPPVDPTTATLPADAWSFLYAGPDATQTGVTPGAIDPERVALASGRFIDRDGLPVPNVHVKVAGGPEYGHTRSREDGRYDLAVSGGGTLTLRAERDGYLAVDRVITLGWHETVTVPDVVMTPLDPIATTVALGAPTTQVAVGSLAVDDSGARQGVLVVPPGTMAQVLMPDGTPQPMSTLTLRLTEYTVGPQGPKAMPAPLPPTTGYTYAIELSADEATGGGRVEFDRPLAFYVENFLGFPVGEPVPAGFYDPLTRGWTPSANGVVLRVLDTSSGVATLDLDGDDVAESSAVLEAAGITAGELTQLAGRYDLGTTLWRVPITHFTAWDCNWPFGPPPCEGSVCAGNDGNPPPPPPPPCGGGSSAIGSIIKCEEQSLGETLDVTGTPFSLNYRTTRARGYAAGRQIRLDLTGPAVHSQLKAIDVTIDIAGQHYAQSFPKQANLSTIFTWDGQDGFGRPVFGSAVAKIEITATYPGVYNRAGSSFGAASVEPGGQVVGSLARMEIGFIRRYSIPLEASIPLEGWALGGWTLSPHHFYDGLTHTLHLGTGESIQVGAGLGGVERVAGNGTTSFAPDGTLARDGGLSLGQTGFSAAPNGDIYVAVSGTVRRIDHQDGRIWTVAGSQSQVPCPSTGFGDGGLATSARLAAPSDVAVAGDGSAYIADPGTSRIRRIRPDGIIETVAGGGPCTASGNPTPGYSGDGGPATLARLNNPKRIALAPDGSLFILDLGNNRVRKVDTMGIITTVAGNGSSGAAYDVPALLAPLANLVDLAAGPDGVLYLAKSYNLLSVQRDGMLRQVSANFSGSNAIDEGVPMLSEAVDIQVWSLATGPDGTLYFNDDDWQRSVHFGGVNTRYVRAISPTGIVNSIVRAPWNNIPKDGSIALGDGPAILPSLSVSPDGSVLVADSAHIYRVRPAGGSSCGVSAILIPSSSGESAYCFDEHGRHLKTFDLRTNATLFSFGYADGQLASVTDGDGNVTTVSRSGGLVTITAPFGQATTLELDSAGNATSIADAGGATTLQARPDGLLSSMIDRRGLSHDFEYSPDGLLTRDEGPAGGVQSLAQTLLTGGKRVERTTALGRTTVYDLVRNKAGLTTWTVTAPELTSTVSKTLPDGSREVRAADGTLTTTTLKSDPTFGLQQPFTGSRTVKLPSGLTMTTTENRAAVLAVPSDPLSVTSQTMTRNINGKTWTTQYTSATQTYVETSPLNRHKTRYLDDLGRTIRVEIDGLAPIEYAYDSNGRLSATTTGDRVTTAVFDPTSGYGQSLIDARGTPTDFTRDALGRTVTQTRGGATTAFGWDPLGNLESVTPPGKPQHGMTYTPVNLVESYDPPNASQPASSTSYAYDVDRMLRTETRPNAVQIVSTPDAAGRLDTIAIPGGLLDFDYYAAGLASGSGKTSDIRGPYGTNLHFTYDGSLTTKTTWSGHVAGSVAWQYNNDFNKILETVTGSTGSGSTTFGYDTDQLLTCASPASCSGTSAANALRLTRNQTGLVTGIALGNTTETLSYNAFGELATQSTAYGASPVADITYDAPGVERDQLGRIVQKTEVIFGVTNVFGYTYDALGRLTDVTLNGTQSEHFTYDQNGNRTSAFQPASGTSTGVYDEQDRLLSYGPWQFTYTLHGELETKTNTVSGDAWLFQYDALGNLLTVGLPNGDLIEYLVDGRGRRIAKKKNGALQKQWLYRSSLNPVAELDASGALIATYAYASKPNIPDYILRAGSTYRIISDHLGSPRYAVNIANPSDVPYRADYTSFGEVTGTGLDWMVFGFAGGLYDAETGLVRFGARDYDPSVGRWTAKDPIRFKGGQANLSAYVNNDPINKRDPRGTSVLLCRRVADLPLNSFFQIEHHFLAAGGRVGGAGHCGGGVPGHGGADLPFSAMCMNDHSSETSDEVICEEVNADEDCVAGKLNFGDALGPWAPPFNDCQTSAHDIIAACSNLGTFYPFGGSEGAPGWLGSEGGTFGY